MQFGLEVFFFTCSFVLPSSVQHRICFVLFCFVSVYSTCTAELHQKQKKLFSHFISSSMGRRANKNLVLSKGVVLGVAAMMEIVASMLSRD